VQSTGLYVNGKSASGSFAAAIDTGTTLVYVPSADAASFWAAVPGARATSTAGPSIPGLGTATSSSYEYPCDTSITAAIGFTNVSPITISNDNLNIGAGSTAGYCQGAIMGMDFTGANGEALAIVGDVFLKNVYAVFDIKNLRVGFAPPA